MSELTKLKPSRASDGMRQPLTARLHTAAALIAAALVHYYQVRVVLGQQPPNIVILFADNVGYNDISIFGAPTAQTPHIDSLGRDGLKLHNWNSAAHLCSASRAALLTGKYPVRTGVYPGVFTPGAEFGLSPEETTLAEHLQEEGYATRIVGKWHLGHRPDFLPTNQGFDEWIGIPYHMSGGSVDNHTCSFDRDETVWLPLYQNATIVQQPVRLEDLADRYATAASSFIQRNVDDKRPFFLYVAFSHVHQLCAPKDAPEQAECQWAGRHSSKEENGAPPFRFVHAIEEMDWIVGQVLKTIGASGVTNETLVLFTSDNGPWIAEQECSGSKGPFEGRWLQDNVELGCTACPHDYVARPTEGRPRRCVLPGTALDLDGVHCGEDTGLGSVWEANIRMPALARWPTRIAPGTDTMALVSTLDVVPTVLSIIGRDISSDLDGIDVSRVLMGEASNHDDEWRALFFWRDGFRDGPLPPPFGRFDVVAAKVGRYKAWFSTKSAHYNDDDEAYHDPPMLFDVLTDPAEAFPLDPLEYAELITNITELVKEHKEATDWQVPLTLSTDPSYIPCVDRTTQCRTVENLESLE